MISLLSKIEELLVRSLRYQQSPAITSIIEELEMIKKGYSVIMNHPAGVFLIEDAIADAEKEFSLLDEQMSTVN